MPDTLETLAAQTLESRRRNIREEIARQADMQFCIVLTEPKEFLGTREVLWTDPIDNLVSPGGREMLVRALTRQFPFATPQSIRSANTWLDLFVDLLQRVPSGS